MYKQSILSTLRLLFGISLCWLALSMLSDVAAQNVTWLGLLSFIGLAVGMLIIPDQGT